MKLFFRVFNIAFLTIIVLNVFANDTIVNKLISNYQYSKAINILTPKENKSLSNYSDLGFCFYKMGNYQSSIENYELALQKDSTNAIVLFRLGNIYKKETEYQKSKEIFESLLSLDTTNNYYLKQLALVNVKLKDYDTSISQFNSILFSNNKDVESIIEISKLYFIAEKSHLADSILTLGINIHKKNTRLLFLGIKASYLSEQFNKSIDLSNEYIKYKTPTYSVKKIMAFSHYNLSNYDSAIVWLNKIEGDNRSEQINYYTALSYFKKHNYKEATAFFNKAIEEGISTDLAKYYMYLGLSLEEMNMFSKSISAYKKSYQYSGKDIILYHIARNYDKNFNDKKAAKKYYKRYLALNDTVNKGIMEYSILRLTKINEDLHFEDKLE